MTKIYFVADLLNEFGTSQEVGDFATSEELFIEKIITRYKGVKKSDIRNIRQSTPPKKSTKKSTQKSTKKSSSKKSTTVTDKSQHSCFSEISQLVADKKILVDDGFKTCFHIKFSNPILRSWYPGLWWSDESTHQEVPSLQCDFQPFNNLVIENRDVCSGEPTYTFQLYPDHFSGKSGESTDDYSHWILVVWDKTNWEHFDIILKSCLTSEVVEWILTDEDHLQKFLNHWTLKIFKSVSNRFYQSL